MNCSRMDYSRQTDYSAVVNFDGMAGLQNQIARRVGRRKTGMTLVELQRWFAATPDDFVETAARKSAHDNQIGIVLRGKRRPLTEVFTKL